MEAKTIQKKVKAPTIATLKDPDTVANTATALKVSAERVYVAMRRMRDPLPHYRAGNRYHVRGPKVSEWLDRNPRF